jgi:hypothetical protein
LIGLDFFFQKTPTFTTEKRTLKPGDAVENTAFEQWLENVKGCREAVLHLFVKQIPPKIPSIKLIQICVTSILLRQH